MVKFGPWAPDQPYTEGVCVEVVNALSYAEKYRALPTVSTISASAVVGTVVAGYSTRLVSNVSKTYAATAAQIYERNGAGWTTVSSGTYTLAAGSRWEFTQYGADVFAISIDEVLQKQTAGSGNFAAVANGPTAACMHNVRQFVVVGDVDEASTLYPHKIRWSAIGDPDDWAASEATQSGAQELDARDGRVMALRGGEFGLILQQHAITRMSYIGAPIVWQFDKIDDRNGCEVSGSVVQVGREVYFLSHDGWRVTDGSGQSVNIGDGLVNSWFRDNVSTANKHKIRGAYNPDWRAVVWSFPSSGGLGVNDSLLIYSVADKRWSRGSYGVTTFFEGATSTVTLEGVDSYFATLESVTPGLDDPFWIGGEFKFLGINGGLLVALDNTPGTATIETGDYQLNVAGVSRLQAVEPIIDGTVTVQVGYRNVPTDTITYTAAQGVYARTGQASFQHAARWNRVRFAITGSFYEGIGFNLKAKNQGRG